MTGDALSVLAEECAALSAVLHGLGRADWQRATNCPPWDLRELVVHIGASIAVRGPLPPAEPGADRRGTADYYRRPERNTTEYRQGNVDRTRELAGRVAADVPPAGWFDGVVRDTLAYLRADDPDRVVRIIGVGSMRLADWTATRVISVAVHGLDVALTLGRPAWTVPPALDLSRDVFVALLGGPPPPALGWDDGTFLAAATGRRALTDLERAVLGSDQERFPLVS